jgi:release factor glutamine methyltransferase
MQIHLLLVKWNLWAANISIPLVVLIEERTMLLKEIKEIFHLELDTPYGKDEVSHFFYLFMEQYLNLERFALALDPDIVLSKEQEEPFFNGLSQLKLGRPIQYILGKTSFMALEFDVNEHVLIPRPETEELVQWVINDFKTTQDSIKVLDIGTGSGCIAITLAKYLPKANVQAIDISESAIDLAMSNAKKHHSVVSFYREDMRNMRLKETDYSIIVSNPPYVMEKEKAAMHKNVKDYEPQGALFVPDADPLLYYKHIVEIAKTGLKDGGCLYLEINQNLGGAITRLLEDANFSEIELRKDIFAKDRMVKSIWNKK